MTGQQAAVRQVLRVEEFLPCSPESVWRALTDPDLIACWLMPNDFRLEAGHRFAIDSNPVRQCGLGGTGHCEVLAFDEGTMLRIAWAAAGETMSGLDSAVTFTVAPQGSRHSPAYRARRPPPVPLCHHRDRLAAGRLPLLHPAHRRGGRNARRLARRRQAPRGGAFRRCRRPGRLSAPTSA